MRATGDRKEKYTERSRTKSIKPADCLDSAPYPSPAQMSEYVGVKHKNKHVDCNPGLTKHCRKMSFQPD